MVRPRRRFSQLIITTRPRWSRPTSLGPLDWLRPLPPTGEARAAWRPEAFGTIGSPDQRENLWMGSRGAYSPEQMVRTGFRKGLLPSGMPFPHVSRTGNWADVAHYTQVVWKGTTHVGCAIHPSAKWDYLICRYSPPGNVDGRTAI